MRVVDMLRCAYSEILGTVVVPFPLHRCRNGSPDGVTRSPKVTELAGDELKIQTQAVRPRLHAGGRSAAQAHSDSTAHSLDHYF